MNVELAEMVIRQIEAEPQRLNMSYARHCGTPGCVAGWTLFLAGIDLVTFEGDEMCEAARLLDIPIPCGLPNCNASYDLFYPDGFSDYRAGAGAKEAVAKLRAMIQSAKPQGR